MRRASGAQLPRAASSALIVESRRHLRGRRVELHLRIYATAACSRWFSPAKTAPRHAAAAGSRPSGRALVAARPPRVGVASGAMDDAGPRPLPKLPGEIVSPLRVRAAPAATRAARSAGRRLSWRCAAPIATVKREGDEATPAGRFALKPSITVPTVGRAHPAAIYRRRQCPRLGLGRRPPRPRRL